MTKKTKETVRTRATRKQDDNPAGSNEEANNSNKENEMPQKMASQQSSKRSLKQQDKDSGKAAKTIETSSINNKGKQVKGGVKAQNP